MAMRWSSQPIRPRFHLRAQLFQFRLHGVATVGFLHPPTADVAQAARSIGIQGQRRGGHGGVRDQVEIGVERLQARAVGHPDAGHFDPIRTVGHVGAHVRQRIGKGDVALNAVSAHARHAQRTSANRTQRQEIGRRGGIAFHRDLARTAVAGAAFDHEAAPTVAPHLHAKARHQVQRDFDVRLGDQFANHFDRDGFAAAARLQRCSQQQGGQELAGHRTLHARHGIRGDLTTADMQRRIARLAQIVDPGA
ncbi:hypothetical protein G6F65_018515 [Rhizopus arrhizus]|nr:hypothetical protein G6F65_018515 [Rhizopus arrhizus]